MAKAKYTRQSNGYFQTRVWDGTYNEDAKKNYVTLRTKESSKVLEKLVTEHNHKIENRQYVRTVDISFYEYSQRWKTVYKSSSALNTQQMYDNLIEKHIVKIKCNVGQITRAHYLELINTTKGDRTKQQLAMTMKQIVKSAIKDKVLPAVAYSDIFDDTPKIKYKSEEKRPLTDNEKKALKKAKFKPEDEAFVYILYGCGLRRGEALALTRFDISLDKKEISVNKAIAMPDNAPVLKDTKNGKHRIVPIPASCFPVIEAYVKSLRTTKLFHMADGSYITKSSYIKKWARIIKAMNECTEEPIEDLTAHIFRHNYCTSLCYKIPEISIPKIAELLGDTEKMVIEVYNHEVATKEKPAETVTNALAL